LSRPIRVLLVEDSDFDAALLLLELRKGGFAPEHERVETAQAMSAALERNWDVIISDYVLPGFSGPAALKLTQQKGLDLPFIIVSGVVDEADAVASFKAGAHDFVGKQRLTRLVPAIERELDEARVRRARRRAEEERRQAQEELAGAHQALQRANDELEQRVRDRTADLLAANDNLQESIRERQRLENELLEITEKERRRVGMDLHDDLGQKLAGLTLMMKGLELGLTRRKLPEARDAQKISALVGHMVTHAGDLARDLTLGEVNEKNLPSALKDLAANVTNLFAISCKFKTQGATPSLDRDTVNQFYKITQEAVTNAVRHGKASHVGIDLVRKPDRLVLSIRNNGLPFPSMIDTNRGMGLRIMNYRASVIGASLDIRPRHPKGAVVTCSFPMPWQPARSSGRALNGDQRSPA
jgi:signal transduction histidine kinase